MVRDSIASDYPSRAELEATGARDVAPGKSWAFKEHKTMADIERTRKQAAELANALGISLFLLGGKIRQKDAPGAERFDPPSREKLKDHGLGNAEPANFGVNYEGIGEKL